MAKQFLHNDNMATAFIECHSSLLLQTCAYRRVRMSSGAEISQATGAALNRRGTGMPMHVFLGWDVILKGGKRGKKGEVFLFGQ